MHRFTFNIGLWLLCLVTASGVSSAPGDLSSSPVVPPTTATIVMPPMGPSEPVGDRVACSLINLNQWIPAALSREDYRVGPGDVLSVNVQGRASMLYSANPNNGASGSPNEVSVSPGGDIYISLAGKIPAAGKTVVDLEEEVRSRLSEYIRSFDVAISVVNVHTVNIWISGEVDNPGPRIVPAVSTVSLAVLQAQILPTGSTRRITHIRGDKQRTVDLYKMMITGDVSSDIPLEPGDRIHVPAIRDYVDVSGEIARSGRYEMVGKTGKSGEMTLGELMELSLGVLPSAAPGRSFIERIGDDGRKVSVNVHLRGDKGDADAETALQSGDSLVVPSIAAFQPMIRLIGEFRGDGVYQRVPGTSSSDMENKSGVYFLKQGQTAGEVITVTGGVTPQADLKRARVERKGSDGRVTAIPVDLERLLVHGDKSADVVLANGDSLVLPAVADRVHVFGQVRSPGSYVYSPSRKLMDYLGDARGPTDRAKMTDVSVVRVTAGEPKVLSFNTQSAMRSGSFDGNPELEPGDIVFVPEKIVSGWRDGLQLVFSSLSLISLLQRL